MVKFIENEKGSDFDFLPKGAFLTLMNWVIGIHKYHSLYFMGLSYKNEYKYCDYVDSGQ